MAYSNKNDFVHSLASEPRHLSAESPLPQRSPRSPGDLRESLGDYRRRVKPEIPGDERTGPEGG
eukprot:298810-Amorphochlora_amoeboformis.AAC.1